MKIFSVHDKISVCPEEIDFVSDRASRRRAARDPQHERKTKSIVLRVARSATSRSTIGQWKFCRVLRKSYPKAHPLKFI